MDEERSSAILDEEKDRYIVHLHELSEMSNIAIDISKEIRLMKSKDRYAKTIKTNEQYDRIIRETFKQRCSNLDLNPTAYISGVNLAQAINTIKCEINSFTYAVNINF
jgi:hypothetical protein